MFFFLDSGVYIAGISPGGLKGTVSVISSDPPCPIHNGTLEIFICSSCRGIKSVLKHSKVRFYFLPRLESNY